MDTQAALYEHLKTHFSGAVIKCWRWGRSPTEDTLPGFCVLEAEISRSTYLYLTCGASDVERPGHPSNEFFVLVDKRDTAIVELLAMVAFYHATADAHIRLGHVLPFGESLVAGSNLEAFLPMHPYLYDPSFERVALGRGEALIWWLFPISAREADYVDAEGAEALETLFEDEGVDYRNLLRREIVKAS